MGQALLYVLVICFVNARAAKGEDLFNYGSYWSQFTPQMKEAYIIGVKDGTSRAYFAAVFEWLPGEELAKKPPSPRIEKVRLQVHLMSLDVITLVKVMNDLYKDPANSFIDTIDILYIARDKLVGKTIEDQLLSARRRAIANHNLTERLKNGGSIKPE